MKDILKSKHKQKLNGTTMLTILFALFLLVIGVAVGTTYSAFQNTAQSNGTMSFAVNGHQGTLNLSNTKVASYNSTDLTLVFTLASDTGYNTPTISGITMGGTPLTQESTNFKSDSIVVATYSSSTLTINRANVTGTLVITGSSTASTYTITYNSNGGSGSMSNTTANYGSTVNLRTNTFTRANAEFLGWATSANGSLEFGNGARVKDIGDTNLYAVWRLEDLSILVSNTTSYYNINGSLYSRSSAYYKCSTCNGYSTSSTNTTGCTHNYSSTPLYHKCSLCSGYFTEAGGNSSNYCGSPIFHPEVAAYYDPCTICGGSGCDYSHYHDWQMYDDSAAPEFWFRCSYCGMEAMGVDSEPDSYLCRACGGDGDGTYHPPVAAYYTYNAHNLSGNYYKCSYCNGYSTTSGQLGACNSHNHSYNTSTLYYDYTKQYGTGSASISKSSATYSTGYYWSADYGALQLDSEFTYTDGYAYRVIEIITNTSGATLKARRKQT